MVDTHFVDRVQNMNMVMKNNITRGRTHMLLGLKSTCMLSVYCGRIKGAYGKDTLLQMQGCNPVYVFDIADFQVSECQEQKN